jgi:hypothetical protein
MSFSVPKLGDEIEVDGVKYRVTSVQATAKERRDFRDRRACSLFVTLTGRYQDKDYVGEPDPPEPLF